MSSWISFGPGFFEPLTDFNSLPDPGWVVWSRKLRKGKDAIPTRANPASAKGKTADHKVALAASMCHQTVPVAL